MVDNDLHGSDSSQARELHANEPPAAPPAPTPSDLTKTASSDALGFDPAVRGLAELAVHRASRTPMTLALLGPAGSGKSFALARMIELVGAFSRAAANGASAFVSNALVARVEAGAVRDPAPALAGAVFSAMQTAGAETASLAEDAACAGADPVDAARAASERLIDLRRRLDGERRTLSDLSGRRARLTEAVLFQDAGSRIDSWARANRSRIEGRLRGFGFRSGDPVATYKDLVRDLSENRGAAGRITAFAHAMWGFRGQARLLVLAFVFFLMAWALGLAQGAQFMWADWLAGRGDFGASAASWVNANGPAIFGAARTLLFWAAVACIALNVYRAARFMAPLWRGVGLLDDDLQTGQRELDTLIGNQTRLVDDLSAQAEAQARRADDAERRAASLAGRRTEDSVATPFQAQDGDSGVRQARQFFRALARETAGGAGPQRIVVAVDGLDSLSPQQAAAFVDEASALLAQPPFVLVIAADPQRLGQAWGPDQPGQLGRRVHIGVRVDAASSGDYGRLVRKLLARDDQPAEADEISLDVADSILDRPVAAEEAALLEALAPLAGRTPRCVAQFVSVYRLGRVRADKWPLFAFALALDIGGAKEEKAAVSSALVSLLPDQTLDPAGLPSRVREAMDNARAANGGVIVASEMRAAMTLASTYSLNV